MRTHCQNFSYPGSTHPSIFLIGRDTDIAKGPLQIPTVTLPSTTSTSYVCLLSTGPSTSTTLTSLSVYPPTATASPIPQVKPNVQALIDELATALLYVELIGNAGNLPKLCSTINPSGLDAISGIGINGTTVQEEVCASALIQIQDSSFISPLIAANRRDVTLLFTVLFAVQVAGGYAGGTDLKKLCSEIDERVLDTLFINGAAGSGPGTGTAAKNFVCDAASST